MKVGAIELSLTGNKGNDEHCIKCQGKCCKRIPGICTPRDIQSIFPGKTLAESIEQALCSGYFSIDFWCGEPNRYYIRPATKQGFGKRVDDSWGGVCIFLRDDGCALPGAMRPTQCRKSKWLSPNKCQEIPNNRGKLEYAKIWERAKAKLEEVN